MNVRVGGGVDGDDVGVYWWHSIGFLTSSCVMVRVVRFWGTESLSSSGCASGFASFRERFLGLGARVSFDAIDSASGESICESGKSFASLVFVLADERVTRLLGSGADAQSEVFWRFGGMFAVA